MCIVFAGSSRAAALVSRIWISGVPRRGHCVDVPMYELALRGPVCRSRDTGSGYENPHLDSDRSLLHSVEAQVCQLIRSGPSGPCAPHPWERTGLPACDSTGSDGRGRHPRGRCGPAEAGPTGPYSSHPTKDLRDPNRRACRAPNSFHCMKRRSARPLRGRSAVLRGEDAVGRSGPVCSVPRHHHSKDHSTLPLTSCRPPLHRSPAPHRIRFTACSLSSTP